VLTGVLSGCGPADQPPADGASDGASETGDPVRGGDEGTTAASLAWVTAEHLGKPASAAAETDISGELGPGSVGTDLLYRPSPGDDGDRLTVAVGKGTLEELGCRDPGGGAGTGCVRTSRGTVLWERAAPGEDPGNVAVGVRKGAVTVLVFQSGPDITGDPRRLRLPIAVSDMFEIAEDPRIDVTTSRAAVDAGSALSYWTP
jgi:hypothetical protein